MDMLDKHNIYYNPSGLYQTRLQKTKLPATLDLPHYQQKWYFLGFLTFFLFFRNDKKINPLKRFEQTSAILDNHEADQAQGNLIGYKTFQKLLKIKKDKRKQKELEYIDKKEKIELKIKKTKINKGTTRELPQMPVWAEILKIDNPSILNIPIQQFNINNPIDLISPITSKNGKDTIPLFEHLNLLEEEIHVQGALIPDFVSDKTFEIEHENALINFKTEMLESYFVNEKFLKNEYKSRNSKIELYDVDNTLIDWETPLETSINNIQKHEDSTQDIINQLKALGLVLETQSLANDALHKDVHFKACRNLNIDKRHHKLMYESQRRFRQILKWFVANMVDQPNWREYTYKKCWHTGELIQRKFMRVEGHWIGTRYMLTERGEYNKYLREYFNTWGWNDIKLKKTQAQRLRELAALTRKDREEYLKKEKEDKKRKLEEEKRQQMEAGTYQPWRFKLRRILKRMRRRRMRRSGKWYRLAHEFPYISLYFKFTNWDRPPKDTYTKMLRDFADLIHSSYAKAIYTTSTAKSNRPNTVFHDNFTKKIRPAISLIRKQTDILEELNKTNSSFEPELIQDLVQIASDLEREIDDFKNPLPETLFEQRLLNNPISSEETENEYNTQIKVKAFFEKAGRPFEEEKKYLASEAFPALAMPDKENKDELPSLDGTFFPRDLNTISPWKSPWRAARWKPGNPEDIGLRQIAAEKYRYPVELDIPDELKPKPSPFLPESGAKQGDYDKNLFTRLTDKNKHEQIPFGLDIGWPFEITSKNFIDETWPPTREFFDKVSTRTERVKQKSLNKAFKKMLFKYRELWRILLIVRGKREKIEEMVEKLYEEDEREFEKWEAKQRKKLEKAKKKKEKEERKAKKKRERILRRLRNKPEQLAAKKAEFDKIENEIEAVRQNEEEKKALKRKEIDDLAGFEADELTLLAEVAQEFRDRYAAEKQEEREIREASGKGPTRKEKQRAKDEKFISDLRTELDVALDLGYNKQFISYVLRLRTASENYYFSTATKDSFIESDRVIRQELERLLNHGKDLARLSQSLRNTNLIHAPKKGLLDAQEWFRQKNINLNAYGLINNSHLPIGGIRSHRRSTVSPRFGKKMWKYRLRKPTENPDKFLEQELADIENKVMDHLDLARKQGKEIRDDISTREEKILYQKKAQKKKKRAKDKWLSGSVRLREKHSFTQMRDGFEGPHPHMWIKKPMTWVEHLYNKHYNRLQRTYWNARNLRNLRYLVLQNVHVENILKPGLQVYLPYKDAIEYNRYNPENNIVQELEHFIPTDTVEIRYKGTDNSQTGGLGRSTLDYKLNELLPTTNGENLDVTREDFTQYLPQEWCWGNKDVVGSAPGGDIRSNPFDPTERRFAVWERFDSRYNGSRPRIPEAMKLPVAFDPDIKNAFIEYKHFKGMKKPVTWKDWRKRGRAYKRWATTSTYNYPRVRDPYVTQLENIIKGYVTLPNAFARTGNVSFDRSTLHPNLEMLLEDVEASKDHILEPSMRPRRVDTRMYYDGSDVTAKLNPFINPYKNWAFRRMRKPIKYTRFTPRLTKKHFKYGTYKFKWDREYRTQHYLSERQIGIEQFFPYRGPFTVYGKMPKYFRYAGQPSGPYSRPNIPVRDLQDAFITTWFLESVRYTQLLNSRNKILDSFDIRKLRTTRNRSKIAETERFGRRSIRIETGYAHVGNPALSKIARRDSRLPKLKHILALNDQLSDYLSLSRAYEVKDTSPFLRRGELTWRPNSSDVVHRLKPKRNKKFSTITKLKGNTGSSIAEFDALLPYLKSDFEDKDFTVIEDRLLDHKNKKGIRKSYISKFDQTINDVIDESGETNFQSLRKNRDRFRTRPTSKKASHYLRRRFTKHLQNANLVDLSRIIAMSNELEWNRWVEARIKHSNKEFSRHSKRALAKSLPRIITKPNLLKTKFVRKSMRKAVHKQYDRFGKNIHSLSNEDYLKTYIDLKETLMRPKRRIIKETIAQKYDLPAVWRALNLFRISKFATRKTKRLLRDNVPASNDSPFVKNVDSHLDKEQNLALQRKINYEYEQTERDKRRVNPEALDRDIVQSVRELFEDMDKKKEADQYRNYKEEAKQESEGLKDSLIEFLPDELRKKGEIQLEKKQKRKEKQRQKAAEEREKELIIAQALGLSAAEFDHAKKNKGQLNRATAAMEEKGRQYTERYAGLSSTEKVRAFQQEKESMQTQYEQKQREENLVIDKVKAHFLNPPKKSRTRKFLEAVYYKLPFKHQTFDYRVPGFSTRKDQKMAHTVSYKVRRTKRLMEMKDDDLRYLKIAYADIPYDGGKTPHRELKPKHEKLSNLLGKSNLRDLQSRKRYKYKVKKSTSGPKRVRRSLNSWLATQVLTRMAFYSLSKGFMMPVTPLYSIQPGAIVLDMLNWNFGPTELPAHRYTSHDKEDRNEDTEDIIRSQKLLYWDYDIDDKLLVPDPDDLASLRELCHVINRKGYRRSPGRAYPTLARYKRKRRAAKWKKKDSLRLTLKNLRLMPKKSRTRTNKLIRNIRSHPDAIGFDTIGLPRPTFHRPHIDGSLGLRARNVGLFKDSTATQWYPFVTLDFVTDIPHAFGFYFAVVVVTLYFIIGFEMLLNHYPETMARGVGIAPISLELLFNNWDNELLFNKWENVVTFDKELLFKTWCSKSSSFYIYPRTFANRDQPLTWELEQLPPATKLTIHSLLNTNQNKCFIFKPFAVRSWFTHTFAIDNMAIFTLGSPVHVEAWVKTLAFENNLNLIHLYPYALTLRTAKFLTLKKIYKFDMEESRERTKSSSSRFSSTESAERKSISSNKIRQVVQTIRYYLGPAIIALHDIDKLILSNRENGVSGTWPGGNFGTYDSLSKLATATLVEEQAFIVLAYLIELVNTREPLSFCACIPDTTRFDYRFHVRRRFASKFFLDVDPRNEQMVAKDSWIDVYGIPQALETKLPNFITGLPNDTTIYDQYLMHYLPNFKQFSKPNWPYSYMLDCRGYTTLLQSDNYDGFDELEETYRLYFPTDIYAITQTPWHAMNAYLEKFMWPYRMGGNDVTPRTFKYFLRRSGYYEYMNNDYGLYVNTPEPSLNFTSSFDDHSTKNRRAVNDVVRASLIYRNYSLDIVRFYQKVYFNLLTEQD